MEKDRIDSLVPKGKLSTYEVYGFRWGTHVGERSVQEQKQSYMIDANLEEKVRRAATIQAQQEHEGEFQKIAAMRAASEK
jgi:hypothetical protein